MEIIHISDLHACQSIEEKEYKEFAEKIIESLSIKKQEIFVVVSGDITNKGNEEGFTKSLNFLRMLNKEFEKKEVKYNYLVCPGNHDMIKNAGDSYFEKLDNFIYKLTDDEKKCFGNSSIIKYETGDYEFFLINTSFKEKIEYGLAPLKELRDNLAKNEKVKILIMHHHVIPVNEKDISTNRNTLELLYLLEEYNFKLLLHGHQHINIETKIGKNSLNILGAGGLFNQTGDNTNNQFNFVKIIENEVLVNCYKYIKDLNKNGKIGHYKKM